jgi:hypothetical protein
MGLQKCRIVGKSQSILIILNPIIIMVNAQAAGAYRSPVGRPGAQRPALSGGPCTLQVLRGQTRSRHLPEPTQPRRLPRQRRQPHRDSQSWQAGRPSHHARTVNHRNNEGQLSVVSSQTAPVTGPAPPRPRPRSTYRAGRRAGGRGAPWLRAPDRASAGPRPHRPWPPPAAPPPPRPRGRRCTRPACARAPAASCSHHRPPRRGDGQSWQQAGRRPGPCMPPGVSTPSFHMARTRSV